MAAIDPTDLMEYTFVEEETTITNNTVTTIIGDLLTDLTT